MALNEIYKLSWVWTVSSALPEETSGVYVRQDSSTGFAIGDVAPGMIAVWNSQLNSSGLTTGMKALYVTGVNLQRIEMRKVDPLAPIIDTYQTGLPIAGTASGDSLPYQNSIIASWRTANIGRSYRGRSYWPAPAESVVNPGFTLTQASQIAAQFGGLNTALEGSLYDISLVVFSRFSKTVTPAPPHLRPVPIATPVVSVKIDENLRAQRRREPRPAAYATAVAT